MNTSKLSLMGLPAEIKQVVFEKCSADSLAKLSRTAQPLFNAINPPVDSMSRDTSPWVSAYRQEYGSDPHPALRGVSYKSLLKGYRAQKALAEQSACLIKSYHQSPEDFGYTGFGF